MGRVFSAMLKTVVAGILIGAALFLFVVNFSAVEGRFECVGTITRAGNAVPSTVYIKVTEYRWWVHLWSESDGSLWLEIPGALVRYYATIKRYGDQLHILDGPDSLPHGAFSTLSNTLDLGIADEFINAKCSRISA